jgi:hypothetical protein
MSWTLPDSVGMVVGGETPWHGVILGMKACAEDIFKLETIPGRLSIIWQGRQGSDEQTSEKVS